jgi:hypothetical protein
MVGELATPAIGSADMAAVRRRSYPMPTVPAVGSVSLKVFPAVGLVGLSGREAVAEGDGESVERGLPPHRPPGLAGPGRVEGPGDQVEAL